MGRIASIFLWLGVAILSAAETPTKLGKYEVSELPFGLWGLGLEYHASVFNLFTLRGPPDQPYRVTQVVKGSPGHAQGIEVGEEIETIDGRRYDALTLLEVRDLFHFSDTRTKITLGVRRRGAEPREVTLTLDSGKTWWKRETLELDFWGLAVRYPKTLKVEVSAESSKRDSYVARLKWRHSAIALTQAPNGQIVVRQSQHSQPVSRGSVVELREDSTFQISPPAAGNAP